MTNKAARTRQVSSFDELIRTPFAGEVNALCWPRQLEADFVAVLAGLDVTDEIITLDEEMLRGLRRRLEPAGQVAVDIMIADLRMLQERGLQPSLDAIPVYPRDETDAVIATDVYSFHVDRATIEADTYLCTYVGAPSEGVRNEDATRHIDNPATRAKLHDALIKEGGDDFDAFLRDNCYDLHYAVSPDAEIFSFGVGNLWRIAVDYPGAPVLPCIHRAPLQTGVGAPRLLLIS